MEKARTQHDGTRATGVRGDKAWVTNRAYYLMWMEYLAVSPSYELARRYRTGTLTDAEREKLPADFEDVLAVYDDLGDVQRVSFPDWWSERAVAVFGYRGTKPRVRRIDTIRRERKRRAAERLQGFIEGDWTEQGQPNSILVSIPVGLSKAQITRQLGKLLARYEEEHRVLPEPKAKYPLLGTRHRKDTLFRYLYVVWVRAAMPRQALWRVGVLAKVSDTYSRELDAKARVRRGEQDYDRTVLAVLTSRAWSRGVAIAENAARGRFPSYDMPEHAVQPNIHDLWELTASRRRWKKKHGL